MDYLNEETTHGWIIKIITRTLEGGTSVQTKKIIVFLTSVKYSTFSKTYLWPTYHPFTMLNCKFISTCIQHITPWWASYLIDIFAWKLYKTKTQIINWKYSFFPWQCQNCLSMRKRNQMVYSTCEENAGAPEQRGTSLGSIKGEHEMHWTCVYPIQNVMKYSPCTTLILKI